MPVEHSPSRKKKPKAEVLDMKTLVSLRGQAKAQVTRIRNAVEEASGAGAVVPTKAMLSVYSRKLDLYFEEYRDYHHQIMGLCSEEAMEEQERMYEAFEIQHTEACVSLETLMESLTVAEVAPLGPPADQRSEPIPRIIVQQQPLKAPLPTFDGKPENWPRFKAMFLDVMRTSTDSDAIKLYHLDRALVGAAAGIIDSRTLSENNYAHAWAVLEERFENKRVIVDIHVNGLLNLKKLNRENAKDLRELTDEVTRHVDGLSMIHEEMLGVSERIVVNLLAAALDKDTRLHWEASIPHKELPSYKDTMDFLKKRCAVLERWESSLVKPVVNPKSSFSNPSKNQSAKAFAVTKKEQLCELCGTGAHPSFRCEAFCSLDVAQRQAKVRDIKACFNCLRVGHLSNSCPSTHSCTKCQGRHHTLLHPDNPISQPSAKPTSHSSSQTELPSNSKGAIPKSISTRGSWESQSSNAVSCSLKQSPRLCNSLLMTAKIQVLDVNGKPITCRAFLDSGSQAHLVSKSLVESLHLPCLSTKVEVVGANGQRSSLSEMVNLEIRSCYSDFRGQLQCLVTDKVAGLMPSVPLNIQHWKLPPGLPLADPDFHTPGEIDLLIGIQLFFKLLMPGQYKIDDNLPILQETLLGWVVAGSIEDVDSSRTEQHCYAVGLQSLAESMEKFWSVESVDPCNPLTSEEQRCEEIFRSTTRRDKDGRYIVQLPLKESVNQLENNRSIALRRFYMLEHRFQKNPELKRQYVDFINEYKTLGHCVQVDESKDPPTLLKYYLPHHAVLKPTSSSTKLRVVFDASSNSHGPSLNDSMMIGPVVQDDIFPITLRFRKHRYAFSADVSKMYRQIGVDRIHTPLLRIFWRENPNDPLQVLELTTVTYGTSSAPFLATRALRQLAVDEGDNFPVAAKIVLEDFYVDDVLSGAETVEKAIQCRVELTELLSRGGFPIHKWCSNHPAILESVPAEDREQFMTFEDADINQAIKTLGLLWDPSEDVYRFRFEQPDLAISSPTKRNVLSQIAKIFDPLGLVSPVVVVAKVLMQQIWISKLDWDDVLDDDMLQTWISFRDSLKFMHQIKIPRYFGASNAIYYEIHGFADASSYAYGACLYIRAVTQDGVKISLICSKSKITPIKGLTIPRSELCAALLLTRLFMKVVPAVKMQFQSIHFWSDSQIVLAWFKKPLAQLTPFVRNRVAEIVDHSADAKWNYIQSDENPADIVSRGQSPEALASNDLWWHGPQFLRSHDYQVAEPELISDDKLPELKPVSISVAVVSPDVLPVMTAFSSFRKLQRVIGYVRRFARNARLPKSNRITSKYLTVQEMRESMDVIVMYIQKTEFSDEIARLASGEPLRRLGSLNVILKEDILRVGGRLRHSQLPYGAKHQIILPDKNPIVESLLRTLHREMLHIGPSGLIAYTRQRFWILNARSFVKKVIRGCVTCFRNSPRLLQPPMGDLPEVRVVPAPPFSKSGVDFAGPVFIRQGGRKSTLVKAYICLFVCMSTKAIHLELVSDLSASAFVAALHRFVARRGLVDEIFSDNGSNFVGAKSDLHDLFLLFRNDQLQGKLHEFCQVREIKWTFIPPRAPNFGGLWEAGVKSTKTHLKKVLSNASLTFEEYYTVLTQIEAILNSRPLFPSSSDPDELEAITPGHFLIGRELTAIPEPTLEDTNLNRLNRWQHVQRLRDDFWRRWSREYLNTLQTRVKWTKRSGNIDLGTIVLLKEDNLPPQSWKLGRIINVFPGSDSIIRVADVKTSNGVFRRPISKLAPLPFESTESVAVHS